MCLYVSVCLHVSMCVMCVCVCVCVCVSVCVSVSVCVLSALQYNPYIGCFLLTRGICHRGVQPQG